jgi:hypothetical protein
MTHPQDDVPKELHQIKYDYIFYKFYLFCTILHMKDKSHEDVKYEKDNSYFGFIRSLKPYAN